MAAPSVTQTKTGSTASGTGLGLTFTSTPAVGSKIIVTVYCNAPQGTAPTCSDNQTPSNTYHLDATKNDGGNLQGCYIFSAQATNSSGTFTVTTAGVAFTDFIKQTINEVANVVTSTPLDGTPTTATGTSTAPAPGSLATSNANDIIFAIACNRDTANPCTFTTPSVPSAWNSLLKDTNGVNDLPGEHIYLVVSSTLNSNPTWTTGNFLWVAVQAAYKGTAAGGLLASLDWLVLRPCLEFPPLDVIAY